MIALGVGGAVLAGFLLPIVLAVVLATSSGPLPTSTPAASARNLPPATTTTVAPPPSSPPPAPVVAPPPLPPPPAPVALAVTRVIDGDTFVVGPDTIRVLGIDSCETTADAGPAATATANALLFRPVILTAEPGVDRDRYGRLLRYVQTGDGQDFGTAMVRETHTAVYAGTNDASDPYVGGLRLTDTNGRSCDYPDPPPVYVPETAQDDPEPDPDVYDAPAPKRRTGNSGHPCLPGERDGDKDGYCGEGR